MDHFTFGMFADQEAYEAANETPTMVDENGWVEPMDFGDLLSHNQRNLDTLERDMMESQAAKNANDNREWDEKWGGYYERLGA